MDDGQIRVDITGDDEMTIICNRTEMYLYEPKRSLVHEYKLGKHPDKLAQYALLGFAPRGTGLKKDFILTLLEEATLDNHNTLSAGRQIQLARNRGGQLVYG